MIEICDVCWSKKVLLGKAYEGDRICNTIRLYNDSDEDKTVDVYMWAYTSASDLLDFKRVRVLAHSHRLVTLCGKLTPEWCEFAIAMTPPRWREWLKHLPRWPTPGYYWNSEFAVARIRRLYKGRCDLTRVEIPDFAKVGIPSPVLAEGIVSDGEKLYGRKHMDYPAVGIAYIDGPSDAINIGGQNVSKNSWVTEYYDGTALKGTSVLLETDINYPAEGIYIIKAAGGYVDFTQDPPVFMAQDERDVTVNVTLRCEDYATREGCEAHGCYWYNYACHIEPPTCEEITNQADCIRYGCYWYDNACHIEPTPPPEPTPPKPNYLPIIIAGGLGLIVVAALVKKH